MREGIKTGLMALGVLASAVVGGTGAGLYVSKIMPDLKVPIQETEYVVIQEKGTGYSLFTVEHQENIDQACDMAESYVNLQEKRDNVDWRSRSALPGIKRELREIGAYGLEHVADVDSFRVDERRRLDGEVSVKNGFATIDANVIECE